MKKSHAPLTGPRNHRRRWHATFEEMWPWTPPADWPKGVWPYGVWITEDHEEIMFSRDYCPMWRRQPRQPATRADPLEWIDNWRMMYFLHDNWPTPEQSKRLRQSLLIVVAEFVTGGSLLVRDWEGRGRGVPKWGGELIARVPWPPITVVDNNTTHD
jgi:hypothetical protein